MARGRLDNPRNAGPDTPTGLSLLWPGGRPAGARLSEAAFADLALESLARGLDPDGRHAAAARSILRELCADPAVIRRRQDILTDLLDHPDLTDALKAMIPDLAALRETAGPNWRGESPLMPLLARLGELDHYIGCLDGLHAALSAAPEVRSAGLSELRHWVSAQANDPLNVQLRAELPAMRELLGEATSVTIGMNLGPDLLPKSVTLLDLHREPIKGQRTILGRLMPAGGDGSRQGRTPLQDVGPAILRRENPLFKDLVRLLESAAAPLKSALTRYRNVRSGPLGALEDEFAFLTGAATLILRLGAAGVPFCRPEVAPSEERAFVATDLANLTLTLQLASGGDAREAVARVVRNDVGFDGDARVMIVTGPNRGGKTTYCRALGQAQVLFQAGVCLPAASARLSPVDGVWTHFPGPEADQPGSGRLDEEARRLRQLFAEATSSSLILLNEPLTSTSELEALGIATDVVRALQSLGARAVLVTHLHELARVISELNEDAPPGCEARSLVAEAALSEDGVRATYRIVPGAPKGRSYASEIALQHGLTFEQLRQLLQDRGM